MREIQLTKGMVALVDDEDFEHLNSFKWHVSRGHGYNRERSPFYACRSEDGKKVYMHRQVLGAKRGQLCDHIDGDGLNNTRSNLRIVNRSQNACNRPGWGSSVYLGVWRSTKYKKWGASIQINGKKKHLGMFETEKEAALCYNERAKTAFGEYARLNVV